MKIGDIVFVIFPYAECQADKPHPALVLDLQTEGRVVLAYGTSKQVDISCPRPDEVVIGDAEDLEACGLQKPTRFVISVRYSSFARNKVSGALPTHKYKQLFRAAMYCGLL